MNQKRFTYITLVVLVIVFAGAAYLFLIQKPTTSSSLSDVSPKSLEPNQAKTVISFEKKKEGENIVLYKTYSNGSSARTGLEVPIYCNGDANYCKTYAGQNIEIVTSPSQTKAAVRVWGQTPMWGNGTICDLLIVANINGTGRKEVARVCREGSGGMAVNSIQWSDDEKYLQYAEVGGDGFADPPTRTITTYQVDIETGTKTLLSKKTETVK